MKRYQTIFAAWMLLALLNTSFGQAMSPGIVELSGPEPDPNSSIVGFERQQFVVQRVRGHVLIDGNRVASDIVERGSKEIDLIEVFDGLAFSTSRDFRSWVKTLRGARTFTYDNVLERQAGGGVKKTPLVLLPPEQRPNADQLWHAWLAEREEIAEAERQEIALRQQEQSRYEALEGLASRQAATTDRLANLQQTIFGRDDNWLVYLAPRTPSPYGTSGSSLNYSSSGVQFSTGFVFAQPRSGFTVQVTARDSAAATSAALTQYPGYEFAGARKLRY